MGRRSIGIAADVELFSYRRFIERPVFAALWQAFQTWHQQATASPENAPSVFCLRGRRGDGKSVLLLQLAAMVLHEKIVSELVFDEASPDPRRFAGPPGNDVWQFVDELPGLVHGETGERWVKSLRANLLRCVVTTATPVACEWLTRKYPKALNWTIWDLPPVTESEAVGLAEKLKIKNLWRRGDTLEEFLFAGRHCVRVEESNATLQQGLSPLAIESLPVVWAANALGLGAPASLLRPEFREIAKPSSLPVHIAPDGLHVTTPRLALPLLREWFPDAALRLFQLAEGFDSLLERWLKDGEPELSSWFLRRLLHNEYLADVFEHARRKDLFRELYRLHRERQGGRPAVEVLSAWLEIGQAFRLRPDVVEDAADLLEEKAPLSPHLVTDIWLHGERRKSPLFTRIETAATKYFLQTKNDASGAVLRLYREASHLQPALPVAQRWLETHPNHPLFNEVLAALFARSYGEKIIAGWAKDCLGWTWQGKAEGKALTALLQRGPENHVLRQRAEKWSKPNGETPEAGPVLLALLRDGKGELETIHTALLWTANFPRHALTTELWRSLLRHYAGQKEVREIALEWVREWPELPLAAEILVAVARGLRDEPEFAEVVCAWLSAHPEHEQTPTLLEMLVVSKQENIRQALARWLDAQPQHPASARLLASCLSAGNLGPDWVQRAETCLQSGHAQALRPLRALLTTRANERVLAIAVACLPKLPVADRRKLSCWLGDVAASQPETTGQLLAALHDQIGLTEEFFATLSVRLLDMRSQIQEQWLRRGLAELSDDDLQKLGL